MSKCSSAVKAISDCLAVRIAISRSIAGLLCRLIIVFQDQITEHPDLRVASLDWTDALDSHRRDDLVAFFKELKADLIIGADLVGGTDRTTLSLH